MTAGCGTCRERAVVALASALACLETAVELVDYVDPAFSAHDLVIAIASRQGSD